MAKNKKTPTPQPLQKRLWDTIDNLRNNIDYAEYKHIILGLLFLKYISDAFENLHTQLTENKGEYAHIDPEDREETYQAENIFILPPSSTWSSLQKNAKNPDIGTKIDEAMDSIEQKNPSLKGVLPKVYARKNLDPKILGQLIDTLSDIHEDHHTTQTPHTLGHLFTHFLEKFVSKQPNIAQNAYTPPSIATLLIEMLQPQQGRLLDPCCGLGNMLTQVQQVAKQHQRTLDDLSIFGQEGNQTTWQLCKMHLAIKKIHSAHILCNNQRSLLNNAHQHIKVDYLIANPPFNLQQWHHNTLRNDARWKYGTPPENNANYAWIQHFLHQLAPNGQAGFLLDNGSLTSTTGNEAAIRKKLIQEGIIDCIVNLPDKLFLNAQIPACLWFISQHTPHSTHRQNQILFIDARHLGHLVTRKKRTLSPEDIHLIAHTYHLWKNQPPTEQREQLTPPTLAQWQTHLQATRQKAIEHQGLFDPANTSISYQNIPAFCHTATISQIAAHNYVLTPSRYVGLPDEQDTPDFHQHFEQLKAQFHSQIKEEPRLNQRIITNLTNLNLNA